MNSIDLRIDFSHNTTNSSRRFNSSANRNLCVVDELLKRLKCAALREIESGRRTMACVLLSDVAKKKKYKNPWRNIWRHVRPQLTLLNLQSFRALSQFILEIDWTKKKNMKWRDKLHVSCVTWRLVSIISKKIQTLLGKNFIGQDYIVSISIMEKYIFVFLKIKILLNFNLRET